MSDQATTYRKRLRQYERRVSMTVWVGAGLAGLLAITTGSAFNSAAPTWLKALEITIIIIGGVFFGLARVKFEWAATQIKRKLADREVKGDAELSQEDGKWPRAAEVSWNFSLISLPIAGLGMALCFWWPVITNKRTDPPAATRETQSHLTARLERISQYSFGVVVEYSLQTTGDVRS
jgi:purine-cytosine permease-like protein